MHISTASSLRVAGLLALAPSFVLAGIPPAALVFDPDYSPAPTNASQRPPIAKYANADPHLLPFQILGIVGGYVLFTLFVFTCLFTFGRRLRRSAESSASTLAMEMVNRSRPSPTTKHSSNFSKWAKGTSVTTTPVAPGIAAFDDKIIQDHKARQEADMARIYNTVMDLDTKSPMTVSVKEEDLGSSPSLGHSRNFSSSTRSFSQRRPPQLGRESTDTLPISPDQQPVPHSFLDGNGAGHAGVVSSHPYAGRSGTGMVDPSQLAASPRSLQSFEYPPGPSRQPSDASSRSRSTVASRNPERASRAKSARSVRNLTISAPVPVNRYPNDSAADDEARTPLSPRNYGVPMPPPTPPGPRPITPIQDDFEDDDAATHADVYGQLSPPLPLPQAAPQRAQPYVTHDTQRPPMPYAEASASTLPLRAYGANSVGASSTTVGGAAPSGPSLPASPNATKTTYLSPRRERFDAHGFVGMAPMTGGLKSAMTPGGGRVPMTPLSPYMPFTPVTPMTPRLVGREERKQRRREEGRRVANAEEDLVRDEKDMWGSSW